MKTRWSVYCAVTLLLPVLGGWTDESGEARGILKWGQAGDRLSEEDKAEAQRQLYVVLREMQIRISDGQYLSGTFFEKDNHVQITGKDSDGVGFGVHFDLDQHRLTCRSVARRFEPEKLVAMATPWAEGIEGDETAEILGQVKRVIRDLSGLDLDKPIGVVEWVPSFSSGRDSGVYTIVFRAYHQDRCVMTSFADATVANIDGPHIIGYNTFRWRNLGNVPAVPDRIVSAREAKELADEYLRKGKRFRRVRDLCPPKLTYWARDPLCANPQALWVWWIEYMYERSDGRDYPLTVQLHAETGQLIDTGHLGE